MQLTINYSIKFHTLQQLQIYNTCSIENWFSNNHICQNQPSCINRCPKHYQ